ncbi:MAG TPA: hypothetical protein DIU15_14745 [Deltaproteobacteria bacterium]|nr:hypothetical protein [Deltaproteobacteria bacterium]HCP47297.1 hypothetical protein [Deltaproteobacteria bacterium]
MTDKPPAILFDVMDTLVHDPYRQMPQFFGLSWEELAAARTPGHWPDFETGRIDEKSFLDGFFEDRRPYDQEGFLDIFESGYRWLPGMESILSELQNLGRELHVLSNYPLWYQRIETKLKLSQYLPWTFVSCHTGVRKPAVEAFLGAAETLGRPPQECLFIDNMSHNCEAARAVGMDAIVFVDAATLRRALLERALL